MKTLFNPYLQLMNEAGEGDGNGGGGEGDAGGGDKGGTGDGGQGGEGGKQAPSSGGGKSLLGDGGTGGQDTGYDAEVYGKAGEDGRPENVPAKFWDADKKQIKHGDVLKQHNFLDGKMGSFTGAPEDGNYKLTAPEGVEGEFDDKDPLLIGFKGLAKELNMSQDAFDKVVHMWLKNEVEADQTSQANELQALGNNAKVRIQNVKDWIGANLEEALRPVAMALATSADLVKVYEGFIAKTMTPKLPHEGGENPQGITPDQIREERFKKDDKGQELYTISKDHRQKVDQMYKDYYGEQEQQEQVG